MEQVVSVSPTRGTLATRAGIPEHDTVRDGYTGRH